MRDSLELGDSICLFGQFFGLTAGDALYVAIYAREVDVLCACVLWRWNQLTDNARPAWFRKQSEVANWNSGNETLKHFELRWPRAAVAAFEAEEG